MVILRNSWRLSVDQDEKEKPLGDAILWGPILFGDLPLRTSPGSHDEELERSPGSSDNGKE